MVSNKHVFWQAFLSAVLIFGAGIFLGIVFEDYRTRDVQHDLLNSEINTLDSQLLGEIGKRISVGCELSNEALIGFADDIYYEAKRLEDYDESSQLTDTLSIIHRKYDLLRILLWNQAIDLKEQCGRDFYTVVYIFQYKEPGANLEAEQLVFSRALESLKEKYGNDVILIPIAGDLDISSVDLIKERFEIKDYPAVIINEKVVLRNLDEVNKIEEFLVASV